MQLQALVDDLALQVGDPVLGAGGGGDVQLFLEVHLQAAVHVGAGHVELGAQLGELELGVLEIGDALAERLALFHVVQGVFKGAFRHGKAVDGDAEAFLGQFLHQIDEAHAFVADQVFRRHFHVLEKQLRSVLGFHAHFLQVLAFLEAFHALFDDQQAGALGAFAGVGLGHHDHDVGVLAVGDEGLGAVEDVMITVLHGVGLDALQVGAGTGFAHGDGADQLAADHLRQQALLHFLGTVMLDIGRHDFGVQAPADAGQASAGDFLADHHAVEEVGADAAVLFAYHGAQETLLAGLAPERLGHLAGLFPLFVMGDGFVFQELADGVAERLVVGTEQGTGDHYALRLTRTGDRVSSPREPGAMTKTLRPGALALGTPAIASPAGANGCVRTRTPDGRRRRDPRSGSPRPPPASRPGHRIRRPD